MSFVLITIGWLISLNAKIFGDTINLALKERLDTSQKDSFIYLAGRTAQQVEVWESTVFRSLIQFNLMIEQMMEPTYFGGDINNFPLTWDNVQAMTTNDCINDYNCFTSVYFNEWFD